MEGVPPVRTVYITFDGVVVTAVVISHGLYETCGEGKKWICDIAIHNYMQSRLRF